MLFAFELTQNIQRTMLFAWATGLFTCCPVWGGKKTTELSLPWNRVMFENIFFKYHSVTKTKLSCSFIIWTTLKGHRRNIKIYILESAFENDGRQTQYDEQSKNRFLTQKGANNYQCSLISKGPGLCYHSQNVVTHSRAEHRQTVIFNSLWEMI